MAIANPAYAKKDGMATPLISAIDLTKKFGALPIYVKAPIKTAPQEIAVSVMESSPDKSWASPPATKKKTR